MLYELFSEFASMVMIAKSNEVLHKNNKANHKKITAETQDAFHKYGESYRAKLKGVLPANYNEPMSKNYKLGSRAT